MMFNLEVSLRIIIITLSTCTTLFVDMVQAKILPMELPQALAINYTNPDLPKPLANISTRVRKSAGLGPYQPGSNSTFRSDRGFTVEGKISDEGKGLVAKSFNGIRDLWVKDAGAGAYGTRENSNPSHVINSGWNHPESSDPAEVRKNKNSSMGSRTKKDFSRSGGLNHTYAWLRTLFSVVQQNGGGDGGGYKKDLAPKPSHRSTTLESVGSIVTNPSKRQFNVAKTVEQTIPGKEAVPGDREGIPTSPTTLPTIATSPEMPTYSPKISDSPTVIPYHHQHPVETNLPRLSKREGDPIPLMIDPRFRPISSDPASYYQTWMAIVAGACSMTTLLTLCTYWLEPGRFDYPEKPIVYYAVCYWIFSTAYLIGSSPLDDRIAGGRATGIGGTATRYRPTDREVVEQLTVGTAECGTSGPGWSGGRPTTAIITFVLYFYFEVAASLWWVVLTLCWYLTAGRKWSNEAVRSVSTWFHLACWTLPALLTITILLVCHNGTESGIQNPSPADLDRQILWHGASTTTTSTIRAVYLLLLLGPIAVTLSVGTGFMMAGLLSLRAIKAAMKNCRTSTTNLERLTFRISLFAILYVSFKFALVACFLTRRTVHHRRLGPSTLPSLITTSPESRDYYEDDPDPSGPLSLVPLSPPFPDTDSNIFFVPGHRITTKGTSFNSSDSHHSGIGTAAPDLSPPAWLPDNYYYNPDRAAAQPRSEWASPVTRRAMTSSSLSLILFFSLASGLFAGIWIFNTKTVRAWHSFYGLVVTTTRDTIPLLLVSKGRHNSCLRCLQSGTGRALVTDTVKRHPYEPFLEQRILACRGSACNCTHRDYNQIPLMSTTMPATAPPHPPPPLLSLHDSASHRRYQRKDTAKWRALRSVRTRQSSPTFGGVVARVHESCR